MVVLDGCPTLDCSSNVQHVLLTFYLEKFRRRYGRTFCCWYTDPHKHVFIISLYAFQNRTNSASLLYWHFGRTRVTKSANRLLCFDVHLHSFSIEISMAFSSRSLSTFRPKKSLDFVFLFSAWTDLFRFFPIDRSAFSFLLLVEIWCFVCCVREKGKKDGK